MKIFKNKYSEVRSGWKISLTFIMMIALTIITSIIVGIVFMGIEMDKNGGDINAATLAIQSNQMHFVIMAIFQNICVIGTVFVVWKIFEKKKIKYMGITNIIPKEGFSQNGYKELGVGLALGAVTITIVAVVLLLIGSVKLVNPITSPRFSSNLIIGLLAFIAVGFGEEIFGRGYCMSVLKQTRNKWVVLIVSSIIFSAMHLGNAEIGVLPLINIFLIGIAFGYMFMKSSNIWMPIGFHITWNYFQGYIWGFQVSGNVVDGMYQLKTVKDSILNGGAFGAEGGLMVTFVILLTIGFVAMYYKDKNIDDFINNKVEC
ncbi:CPBP family intramembrane metalloprotease [Clostridium gasigenes]|uniref:CPBP family intramembrane glutamic endopeptidase n=1 Tax=Clostridium gasigenes TaxID=94869 RepID=UPI001C0ABB8A|nr:CPBP family intramembrane metalloprotease [Clostridium gasigenes]